MKKLFSLLLLVLSLFIIGCEEPEHTHKFVDGVCDCGETEKKEDVLVTEIKVSGITEIKVSETKSLTLEVLPSNATNKEVEWSSSDNEVLTVENGTVKALKAGVATVTAKAKDGSGKEGTIEINVIEEKVEEIKVESVTVSGKTEINVGDTETLTLEVLPSDAANKEVEWSSSDNEVLTVENGTVKALKAGVATVTAKAKDGSGKEGTIEIKVVEVIDESIALEKLDEFVKTLPEETNKNLPLGNEEYQISYEFENGFNEKGEINQDEFDLEVTGLVKLTLGDITVSKEIKVLVYGYFTDVVFEKFAATLPNRVNSDIKFTRDFDDYGGTKIYITESSNAEVLSKSGVYNIPFHDEVVTLKINVRTTTPKTSRYYECALNVDGRDMKYKASKVMEWVEEAYPRNMILYYDEISLPVQCDDYDATIEWLDSNNNPLDFSKIAQDPVLGDSQVLKAKISIRGETRTETIDYFVWNKRYTSVEEKVEDFVNAMNWQNIGVYKYKSAAYYETNWGYVPFIVQGDAVRNTDYMLEYTYGRVRTNIKKTSTEYVVVHDTAGGAPTHTAESFALNQVQANNNPDNTYISWHFTVGEDGIYQSLPLDEVAYHAGDGSYVYGDIWYSSTYNKADCIGGGNRNGIGIESCINAGADYNVTLRKLAKLVAELLLEFNLSTERIKQHWHFSGKDCPGVIRHCGRWEEFKNLVKAEYFMKTQLQGVEFTYESLSKDVMDDTGKIIVTDGVARTVSYKVSVKSEEFNKDYNFSSTINAYEDWSEK